jgi:hypothetical protein
MGDNIQILGMTIPTNFFLGCIAFICVCLIICLAFMARTNEFQLLGGVWSASAEFCANAGLTRMILVLHEPNLLMRSIEGYIVAVNSSGDVILSNPIVTGWKGDFSISPLLKQLRSYDLRIEWQGMEEDELPDFFPAEQEVYYYPQDGRMVWMAEGEMTAVFYKDTQATSVQSAYQSIETGDDKDE